MHQTKVQHQSQQNQLLSLRADAVMKYIGRQKLLQMSISKHADTLSAPQQPNKQAGRQSPLLTLFTVHTLYSIMNSLQQSSTAQHTIKCQKLYSQVNGLDVKEYVHLFPITPWHKSVARYLSYISLACELG